MSIKYPKISIVTSSYNQGEYLEHTIKSVLGQEYPNLEYIIIDGGSTDNSVDIIKKYEDQLHYWVSEKDAGLYDALNKGFSKSSGEIMGWINSDDMLHRNSLYSLAELFSLPEVNWIQGAPVMYDETGRSVSVTNKREWSKIEFWIGLKTCIQQESTYWSRDLWEKAGAHISTQYKLAGDYELWNRFFKYEDLFTPRVLIGGFRIRTSNQLSLEGREQYFKETKEIREANTYSKEDLQKMNKIGKLKKRRRLLSKLIVFKGGALSKYLYIKILELYSYPSKIIFNQKAQNFEVVEQKSIREQLNF